MFSLAVFTVGVVQRRSGSAKSRVARRSLDGGTLVACRTSQNLVLLNRGEVLSFTLDEELLDAEIALGIGRVEELKLLNEILSNFSVRVGELKVEKQTDKRKKRKPKRAREDQTNINDSLVKG